MESDFPQNNLEKLKESVQYMKDATEVNEVLDYLLKRLKEDSVIAKLNYIYPPKNNTPDIITRRSYVTAEIGALYPGNYGWSIKSNKNIEIPAINVAEFSYFHELKNSKIRLIKNRTEKIFPKLEIDCLWFTSNFKGYITQMELSNLDELLIDKEIPSKIRHTYAYRVIEQTTPALRV